MPATSVQNVPAHLAHLHPYLTDFIKWLRSHASEVRELTSPYESARFTTAQGVGVIYHKDNGNLTWTGGADIAYRAYINKDETWRGGKKRSPRRSQANKIPAIIERDGDECWFCGHRFSEGDEYQRLSRTVEHLCPSSVKGPHHIKNLVIAHEICNTAAGDLSVSEKVTLRNKMRAANG